MSLEEDDFTNYVSSIRTSNKYETYDLYVNTDALETAIVMADKIDPSIDGLHLVNIYGYNSDGHEVSVALSQEVVEDLIHDLRIALKKLNKLNN